MITIKVLNKHIAEGLARESSLCPIACAMIDKGLSCVSVTEEKITFDYNDESYAAYITEKEVTNRIVKYDNTGEMKPFVLQINTETHRAYRKR